MASSSALAFGWIVLFVAFLLLSSDATERAGGAVSPPTPVPTLEKAYSSPPPLRGNGSGITPGVLSGRAGMARQERYSSTPASARGERPAVLVSPAVGRPTATASPTAVIALSKYRNSDNGLVSLGVFRISAYSDSPRNGTDGRGITYSGERTRWGVVAVDPAVIGLHSQLQIEGFGGTVFEAKDRGGAIVGRMVDVWHRTDAEALRFGVREARVWRPSN